MIRSRVKIYLAAPLFNERERELNAELAQRLGQSAEVFLPQRDGALLVELIQEGIPLPVAQARVFELDRRAMTYANLLVAVLDGAHVDEGVAFEIGFAFASGCACIALQTDVRRALPSGNNPMLVGALIHVFSRADDLVEWVSDCANWPILARWA